MKCSVCACVYVCVCVCMCVCMCVHVDFLFFFLPAMVNKVEYIKTFHNDFQRKILSKNT